MPSKMVGVNLLLVVSLATGVHSFTTIYGPASQCQSLQVSWSGNTAAPPFTLLLLPFAGTPVIVTIPTSAWNAATMTGTYSVSIPYASGSRFIGVMDDGNGRGTGGVSQVLTVGESSESSCLSNAGSLEPIFTLSQDPTQCAPVVISWNEPVSPGASIRGFVPNGSPFGLDMNGNATSTTWDVNIAAGTQFVLLFSGGGLNQTSNLLTVATGPTSSCLSPVSPSYTASGPPGVSASTTSAPSASPVTSESRNKNNAGVIAGAVVGGVAGLVLLIAVLLWFRRRSRAQKGKVGVDLMPEHNSELALRPDPYPVTLATTTTAPMRKPPLPYSASGVRSTPSSPPPSSEPLSSTARSQSPPAVVRHEDAGHLGGDRRARDEVVELPPLYENAKR